MGGSTAKFYSAALGRVVQLQSSSYCSNFAFSRWLSWQYPWSSHRHCRTESFIIPTSGWLALESIRHGATSVDIRGERNSCAAARLRALSLPKRREPSAPPIPPLYSIPRWRAKTSSSEIVLCQVSADE